MKFSTVVLLAVGMLCASGVAQADDNTKWIAQCMKDNSDAKVSETIVGKYCACMNNKMDDSETRTITQWEKANPEARKACEKVAGWE
jgi:hypothetical protein